LVNGLLAGGSLNATQAASLNNKLHIAQAALDAGRFGDARNMLNSFVARVQSLIESGALSAADGDLLASIGMQASALIPRGSGNGPKDTSEPSTRRTPTPAPADGSGSTRQPATDSSSSIGNHR
jgi:hypothetical protein